MVLQFEREVVFMNYLELINKANNDDYIYYKQPTDTWDSYRKAQAELDRKFSDDVINVITSMYDMLDKKMVEKIFYQAWEDSHANDYYEVVWRAQVLAELVVGCISEIDS